MAASVSVADQLLREGTIVKTQTRKGTPYKPKANNSTVTDRPLAVLINQTSASVTEILAGALQDHERALIVGQPSFGKATTQYIYGLSDGSKLFVSFAAFHAKRSLNT